MLKLSQRQFNRLALAGLVSMFVLLGLAFAAAVTLQRSNLRANAWVDHSYNVITRLNLLDIHLERTETAARGYLLIASPVRAANYHRNVQRIQPLLNEVTTLTGDNPRQQELIAKLRPELLLELSSLDQIMDRAEAGQSAEAMQLFQHYTEIFRVTRIRELTDAMRAEEVRLLATRKGDERGNANRLGIGLAITGLLLLLAAIASTLLVRRFVSDLNLSLAELHKLNTNLEALVAERTSDLKRANEEIQRFAYIVSHDLRSPLVNIMGFTAELDNANKQIGGLISRLAADQPTLVSESERVAALEDLPEAVEFIRSSTQKMDRLINAILALSRQGKRVLSPQKLKMDEVIGDIAGSLEVMAGERNARFLVETPLPAIVHDRLAIEQIFTNLMENATKYLAKDRPGVISVRGRRAATRAIFEVEDNGRGIAPEDHERVFELFRRAGSQDQAGEGIGLANVRALAYRLGGTVTLRSALGEGSTFVVDVPVEYAEEGKVP